MRIPDLSNPRSNTAVWAVVAIVPFLIMATSFFVDPWGWGLMDDWSLQAMPHQGWLASTMRYFHSTLSGGTCRWTFAAYAAAFYPLFHEAPQLFYLFKLSLVASTLVIFGISAWLITGKKVAIFLVPVIACSFYFF